MLVRLYGKNFRSFKGDFELSLVAADLKNKADSNRGVIEVEIEGVPKPLRLLRTLAIYGPNASGKSTMIEAASSLRTMLIRSSREAEPGMGISIYRPFLLDKQSAKASVVLGCDVVCENNLLHYELEFHNRKITNETLVRLDKAGPVKLIERSGADKVGGELITRSKPNALYVQEMQENVSVLSKLAHLGPAKGKESATPYYKAIINAIRPVDYSYAAGFQPPVPTPHLERFAKEPKYREWIMEHLIRPSDLGIASATTSRKPTDVPELVRRFVSDQGTDYQFPDETIEVAFIHKGLNDKAIPFDDESAGTRKLFNVAQEWYELARSPVPVTFLADELSASLHPRLLWQLIHSLNDMDPTRRSQLVFTTHDTGLLEGLNGELPALRRDQVYFTKKDAEGASTLYSLAEFKDEARGVHNLRKRYISGLYGAIPLLDEVAL